MRAVRLWPVLAAVIVLLGAVVAFRTPPLLGSALAGEIAGWRTGVALLMIDEVGCRFCRRWDEEVGGAYPRSREGQLAPLVRRNRNHPEVAHLERIVYTPTFLVMRDGVEQGRIVGYPGADFFWEELGELLRKAGP